MRDALGAPISPGDRIAVARTHGISRVQLVSGTVTRVGPDRRVYYRLGQRETWTQPHLVVRIGSQVPAGFYLNGDDHPMALYHLACGVDPLGTFVAHIEAGDGLEDLVAAARAHTCTVAA